MDFKTWFYLIWFSAACVVTIHNMSVPVADRWLTWIPYCEGCVAFVGIYAAFHALIWAVKKLP